MARVQQKLGEVRQKLKDRYNKAAEAVRHYSVPDLIQDKLQRTIWGFLNEFGITYPIDLDRPPPDVYVPARQGTGCLDPAGSTDEATPPNSTDRKCMTWRARDSGIMVIDSLDLIMEDPISEDFFTITYQFDEQFNSATFQRQNGDTEFGHWKFNRIVL